MTKTDFLTFKGNNHSSIGVRVGIEKTPQLLDTKSSTWEATQPDGSKNTYFVTLINYPHDKDKNEDGTYKVKSENTHIQVSKDDYYKKGALPVFTNNSFAYYIRESQERYFTDLNKNLFEKGQLVKNWQNEVQPHIQIQLNKDFKNNKKEIVNKEDRQKAIETDSKTFLGTFKNASKVPVNDLLLSEKNIGSNIGIPKKQEPLHKIVTTKVTNVSKSSTCQVITYLFLSGVIGTSIAYFSRGNSQ